MNAETDVNQIWQAWARGDPVEVIVLVLIQIWVCVLNHFFVFSSLRIGDFWTFVSISHTIKGGFVPYLAK